MKKLLFFFLPWISFVSYGQYYNGALGLNGLPLKTALHNIIKNHDEQNWPLWSHFSSTDVRNSNKIWDIYSDIPSGTPPYIFTIVTDQCGTYNDEGQCYNHEHTWPSTFFNDATPMKTDLHHVYPTDGYVNNKRSNFPFGEVTGTVNYTCENGAKLGLSSTYTGYSNNVFEPIDSFKGDIARAYFYMSTRYYQEDGSWNDWVMANGADLTPEAASLLIQWHHDDPVSQKEIDRNNAIYAIQNNRNPFVDYPLFADCIWGTADCTSLPTSQVKMNMDISIYPNPAQSELQLVLPSSMQLEKATLITMLGEQIQVNYSDVSMLKVSLSSINPGVYVLQCQTNKGIIRKTFCKL